MRRLSGNGANELCIIQALPFTPEGKELTEFFCAKMFTERKTSKSTIENNKTLERPVALSRLPFWHSKKKSFRVFFKY
jgi:hypothetical protein